MRPVSTATAFAGVLRRFRAEAGLTQERLAAAARRPKAGYTPSYGVARQLPAQLAARYPIERREPRLLTLLGKALVALDRPTEARDHWQRALSLYTQDASPLAEEVRELLTGL
jgi:transcriptional regulator with XRE-family HTH domain